MTISKALKTRKEVYKPKADFSKFNAKVGSYTVTEEGIFKIIFPTKGEPYNQKISSTPCVITAKGSNIDTGDILYKLRIKDNLNRERTVWRDTKGLMKRSDVMELLGNGMHFQESNASEIIDYFDNFIEQHTEDLPTEIVASRCGWKNDFSIFIIGNYSVSEGGIKETLQVDNTATVFYQQKGDVREFARSANKLLKYPAVRLKAYGGFAAIMLKLLDVASNVIDQYCLSGRLKTVSNWVVAAMFGDPIKLQLDSESTKIGITKVAEYCTDLPMFVDETSKASEHIRKLIYTIGNGNSRVKSNQNQGLDISANFSTVLLTTGESPVLTENARGGEDARVIPLTEGVEEIIPAHDIANIERAIKNNYGHVAVMFLQELFKEKDIIRDIYDAFFEALPCVEDITSNRVKKYYACMATAGYLLEKVFVQIGIDPADPLEVCKRYFEMNVTNTTIVPDYLKILKIAYSWYTANEAHFGDDISEEVEDGKKELMEKYGWVKTVKGEETINFVPETLKAQIVKVIGQGGANRFESALTVWKDLGIINTRTRKKPGTDKTIVLKTCQIRVNGKEVTVIQIPLKSFYEHLELEDSDQTLDSPENSVEAEPKISPINPQELCILEPKDDSELAELLKEGA
jgi:putative DNA primase/helicase